jgi:hypothetical protein
MRHSHTLIKTAVRIVVGLTSCLCLLSAGTAVAAGEPNTWGPVSPLPMGSEPASDEIISSPTGALMRYSSQEGFPSLASFEANGTLGLAQVVTGTSSSAVRGPVAFLPDGTAVISFETFSSGPLDLVVRLPNGAYGPRFQVKSGSPPIVAFAVREGEVLLARATFGKVMPEIVVSSLAIGADGELTETGSTTPVYELPSADTFVHDIGPVAVAMDADGQADLVMHTDGETATEDRNEILDVSRSAQGAWSGPRVLSSGLFEDTHANQLQVAVAPGGRALLTFQDGKFPPCCNSPGADQLASDAYQSVREPGGTFSTPGLVQAIEGNGGVEFKTQVAAGADGTLAESVRSFSCQKFEDTSEVPVEGINLLVAGPGKPLLSHAVTVYDTAAESTAVRIPTVLGAGDGEALLGVQDRTSTQGHQINVCGSEQSEERGRVEDRAVLLGEHESSEKTFASGEYQIGKELSTANLSIGSAGVDTAGDAVVTGSLATSSGAEYDFYTGLPAEEHGTPEEHKAPASGGGTSTATGSNTAGTSSGNSNTGKSVADLAPSRETTAQKLAKALKACKKLKPKHKRLQCEKVAKKKYAKPKKKKKTNKK